MAVQRAGLARGSRPSRGKRRCRNVGGLHGGALLYKSRIRSVLELMILAHREDEHDGD